MEQKIMFMYHSKENKNCHYFGYADSVKEAKENCKANNCVFDNYMTKEEIKKHCDGEVEQAMDLFGRYETRQWLKFYLD